MKKRGISLIVLVVTIIVILILAAVVILTLSKNNPIESAKEASFKEDIRTFQDELAMYIAKEYTIRGGERENKITATGYEKDNTLPDYENSVYKYIPSFNKKYDEKFIIKNDKLMYQEDNLTKDEKKWVASIDISNGKIPVPDEWKKYITEVTEDGVPIPKGFTYKEGTKVTGVVIEDEIHNEFVWIPSTEEEYERDTNFLGNVTPVGEDTILSGLDETLDIKKYGGFYIGRYETTTSDGAEGTKTNVERVPTCQKGKIVWTNISYTNAKKSSEKMYIGNNLSVQSGLLTGKAWDRTCHWIKNDVEKINSSSSLNDSRYYGNYKNSESPANIMGYGIKQVAGSSEKWKVKNIYDIAGNVFELTNESGIKER